MKWLITIGRMTAARAVALRRRFQSNHSHEEFESALAQRDEALRKAAEAHSLLMHELTRRVKQNERLEAELDAIRDTVDHLQHHRWTISQAGAIEERLAAIRTRIHNARDAMQ